MNAKIQNWKDWYFEGKYHCDQCPYSWEDCGYRYVRGRECNAGNASLQGTLYPNSSCIRVQNRGEIYPAGKVGRKILAEVWNTRKEIAYGKEKYNPHKEIEECCSTLRTTPSKWIHHRDYGCNDPFWADGCNMNLLRNHMIYAKNRIQSVCQEYGILPPEELNIPIPPYVDENYFADPNCDRAKKYQMFGSCRNHHTLCSLAEMKAYKIQSENKQEEYKQLQLF